MIVGFQDYWRPGSRFFFTEDPINVGKTIDFGTIETANPTFDISSVKLQDGDGGTLRTVAKENTNFTETYELTLKNFSAEMRKLLFWGSDLQSFSQAAVQKQVGQVAWLGSLIKLRDAYASPYNYIYDVQELRALGIAPNYAITAVTATTFTITLPTTKTAATVFTIGDRIKVYGNATSGANVEYTVTGVSGTGASADITVASTNSATASGRLGVCSASASGVFSQAITGGSATTVTVAGDWTDQYPVGGRFHYFGGTAANNSAPASANPASVDTAVNTYLISASAFAAGTTTITVDTTVTPLPTTPLAAGYITRAARLGYDWEASDIIRGYLKIREDATLITDGQPVCPLFTPRAIASSKRLLYPQARTGPFQGLGLLEWGRGSGAQRTAREFYCSITPASANMQISDFSSFALSVEVLADPTNTTSPAGRMLDYYGSLPLRA